MNQLVIDYGSKTAELYEYYPLDRCNEPVDVSIDVGKQHFAVCVCNQRRILYFGLWKLGDKMGLTMQQRLTSLLGRISSFFQRASTIVIEQQRNQNYVALRLQQHVLSYCEVTYPTSVLVSIPSDAKYRKLDGPLGAKPAVRKQWAIERTHELLLEQNDLAAVRFLQQLDGLKKTSPEWNVKADDCCDAFLQLKAWYLSAPAARKKYLY